MTINLLTSPILNDLTPIPIATEEEEHPDSDPTFVPVNLKKCATLEATVILNC